MQHWETRSTGAEGSVAEEAAYYEKVSGDSSNLYSLKNLATLYFRYPELNKTEKNWALNFGKKPGMQVWSAANFLGYNYQEERMAGYAESY